MSIIDSIREAGVVGAGGAGFPTHVKLNTGGRAEVVIANGAECEPLLRVDQLLMQREAARIVRGLELAMEASGAKEGVIATKHHYEGAVAAMQAAIAGKPNIRLHLMEAYYPSGDEKSLIFEVTGRVVPSAKLPLDVGCVVSNVASLYNIAMAAEGQPVIHKDVTVCGDVPSPLTITAAVGTPARELIALSGFSGREEDYALIFGGPCMGKLVSDWGSPITKTTGGLLILKKSHPMILKRSLTPERQLKLARAVCCQCSQCTQLCPRNALGLHVQPHKAMRALTTGNGALLGNSLSVLACSSCTLCTNYSCNMGLNPSSVMAMLKAEMGKQGIRPVPETDITPDPFIVQKRVPVKRLIARMGLSAFDTAAPWQPGVYQPKKATLPLSQHVGKPSQPVVAVGQKVRAGEVIGQIPEKSLGAMLHASISGTVTAVTDKFIEITGGETV